MAKRAAETLRSLVGDHDPLDPPARRVPFRRAAPVGRRRQGRSRWNSCLVILDEPTAALGVAQTRQVLEAREAARRAGARRCPHPPQPPRHLRGRDAGSPSFGSATTSVSTSAPATSQQEACTAITAGIPHEGRGDRRDRRRRSDDPPGPTSSLQGSRRRTHSRANRVLGSAPRATSYLEISAVSCRSSSARS